MFQLKSTGRKGELASTFKLVRASCKTPVLGFSAVSLSESRHRLVIPWVMNRWRNLSGLFRSELKTVRERRGGGGRGRVIPYVLSDDPVWVY